MAEAYIVAAVRTAGGRRGGKLAGWHPADLAAEVINALVERSGIDPAAVDDVILGCVSQVGEQATNIARNAVLASKLPESVPGTSVDRQCGSSQQALHFAAQAVMSGAMDAVIAGGVESMTRVPMFTPNALPAKAGLGTYMSPGMQRRYPGVEFSQFTGAEMIARNYGIEKDALDRYAFDSHKRAIAATREGLLRSRSSDRAGIGEHTVDEGIRFEATLEGIAGVKLIAEGWTLHRGDRQPDLRRRERRADRERTRPQGARQQRKAAGAHPPHERDGPRPGDHAGGAAASDRTRAQKGRHVDRRHRPLRSQRSLRAGADRLARRTARRPCQAQRERRRHRARPSARRFGHQAHDDARACTGGKRGKRYGLQTMCEGGGMANVTIVERL